MKLRMAEYIERAAVEKYIENGLNNPDRNKAFGFDAVEILYEVHYMPAADVVPVVHGRWIEERSQFTQSGKRAMCTRCDKRIEWLGNPLKYCPNCGAKMDGIVFSSNHTLSEQELREVAKQAAERG